MGGASAIPLTNGAITVGAGISNASIGELQLIGTSINGDGNIAHRIGSGGTAPADVVLLATGASGFIGAPGTEVIIGTGVTSLSADTTASNGNIYITSAFGDIPVNVINAGTGNVTLNAASSIRNVATPSTTTNIIANTASLSAATGIGTLGTHLNIDVGTLTQALSNSGNIAIDLWDVTSSGVTVGSATGAVATTGGAGNIVLTSHSTNTTTIYTVGAYNGSTTITSAGNLVVDNVSADYAVGGGTDPINIAVNTAGGLLTWQALAGNTHPHTITTNFAGSNGPITLRADQMDFQGGGVTNLIAAGSGTVTLKPFSLGTIIGIGSADSGTTLGLTAAELNMVSTTGTVVIGDPANTGGIQISAATDLSAAGFTNLALITGNTGTSATTPAIYDGTTWTGGSLLTLPGTLTLDAKGGIDVTTAVNTIAGISRTAGDIFIEESNGLIIGNGYGGVTGLTTTASFIKVVVALGDLAINADITSAGGAGDAALYATAGSITQGGGTITANNLILSASTGIGTSGNNILTDVTTVAAETTSAVTGDIFIHEKDTTTLDGLTIGSVTIDSNTVTGINSSPSNGLIKITVDTNNLAINNDVNAGTGDAALYATAGSITQGGGTITANNLILSASTGIGTSGNNILTDVTTVAAETTSAVTGDIFIHEKDTTTLDGLTIGSVTIDGDTVTGVNSSPSNGLIKITVDTNNLAINNDVKAGTGDAALYATAGAITQGGGTITANNLILSASTGIGTSGNNILTDVTTVGAETTSAVTGDIFIHEKDTTTLDGLTIGSVTIDGDTVTGVNSSPSNGLIKITVDTNNLAINNDVNAGTGDAALYATAGAITQGGGTITANNLILSASTGIGTSANNIYTDVTTVGAKTTSSGDIFIHEGDGLTIGSVTIDGDTVTGIDSSAGPGLIKIVVDNDNLAINNKVNAGGGDVALYASSGSITTNGGGMITANNLILIASTGIGTSANNILTDVTTVAAETASVVTGDIFINEKDTTTADGLTIGSVTIDGNTVTGIDSSASNGLIKVTVDTNNLLINNAVNAGSGNVELIATAGSITDTGAPGITGTQLILKAANGIGIEPGNPLDTTVSQLDAVNTTNNDINISNTGDLELKDLNADTFSVQNQVLNGVIRLTNAGKITVTDTVQSKDGLIDFTASSPIIINANILSGGGNINQTANNPDGYIYVNATLDSTGGAGVGDINLTANGVDGSNRSIVMNSVSGIINAKHDAILLASGGGSGDIIVSKITAGNQISITANNGSILDDEVETTLLSAPSIILNASGDIGNKNTPQADPFPPKGYIDIDAAPLPTMSLTGQNIYVNLVGVGGLHTSQITFLNITSPTGELGLAADGNLTIDNGLLVLDTPGNHNHNVYLYSTGASILDAHDPGLGDPPGHILDIRANNLFMRAAVNIGSFSPLNPIEVDLGTYPADASAGVDNAIYYGYDGGPAFDIFANNLHGVNIYVGASGNITVGTIGDNTNPPYPNTVNVIVDAGKNIYDDLDDRTWITSQNISLFAVGSIGQDGSSVGTDYLGNSHTNIAGNRDINDTDDIDIHLTASHLTLMSGGDIYVTDNSGLLKMSDITFVNNLALPTPIWRGTPMGTVNNIVLGESAGNILVDATVNLIDGGSGDNLTLAATNLTRTSGNITGTDATTKVLVDNSLYLVADQGIGSLVSGTNPLYVRARQLSAYNYSSGDINFDLERDAGLLESVEITEPFTGAGFGIQNDAGNVKVVGPSLSVLSKVDTVLAGGSIELDAIKGSDLLIDAPILSGGGDVTNTATGNIQITNNGKITTAGGKYTGTADSDSNGAGWFHMTDGGFIDTTGAPDNTITISAGEEVILGVLKAGTSDVKITSTGSYISDGGDGNAVNNISANNLELHADNGYVLIEGIDVNTVTATNVATTITLSDINGITLTSLTTNNGTIDVKAGGLMTATNVVAGGTGDISLETTAGNIAIGTVTAIGDAVRLKAGANITQGAGPGITASNLYLATVFGSVGALGNPLLTNVSSIDDLGPAGSDNVRGNNIYIQDSKAVDIGGINGLSTWAFSNGIIDIRVNGAMRASSIFAGGNSDISLTTTGGILPLIQVGTVTANNNTVTIDSASSIEMLNAGSKITAQNLYLASNSTTTVRTDVDFIDNVATKNAAASTLLIDEDSGATLGSVNGLSTNSGPITVNAALNGTGTLTASSVTSGGNNNITLTTTVANSDILVGSVNATGATVAILSSGAIEQTGGGVNITADSARLEARTGIGDTGGAIETQVSTLAALNTTNDIIIANNNVVPGALDINTVTAGGTTTGITNGIGNITLDNWGALTISQPVSITTSGSINLTAHSPINVNASIIAPGDITLTALENTITPGAGDDITVGNGVLTPVIRSSGGNILLQAGDDIIQNTGTIIQTLGPANTITLHAGNDGTTPDNDGLGAITQNGTARILSQNGNVTLTALQNISVNDVNAGNALLTVTSTTGSIEETMPGDAQVDLTAGTLVLSAVTGIGTNAAAPIETAATTITANTTNGNINLANTNTGATTATSLTTGTGNIDFAQQGGGALTVTTATTTDGYINIGVTQGDLIAGLITAGGAGRNVTLTTTTSGNVFVDNVTATGDRITITSAGAIEENGNDPGADLTADELVLNAQSGIGNLGTIETLANKLDAVNVNNKIDIKNSGALTLVDLNADGFSVKNTNGATSIVAASPLTVSSDVISGSDILLAATESAGADDLTVNANITSTGGNILLQSGDNIIQATGTTIQTNTAGKTIQLVAAFGDTDNIGGITQNGTAQIVSNNGDITLTARDTISLQYVNAGSALLTVTSTNASIEETTNDVAVDLTAGTLALSASTGIGTTGTAPIEIAATAITANTTNGNINLANTNAAATTATSLTTGTGNIIFTQTGGGSLTVTTATTTSGDISISTITSGNIFVDNVSAPGNIVTIISAGSIEEATPFDPGADITASSARLVAVNGIGDQGTIETAVSTLAVSNTTNDIRLQNNSIGSPGALDINTVTTLVGPVGPTSGITNVTGNIILDNYGALTISQPVAVTTNGYIQLTAHSPMNVNNNVTAPGDITLTALEVTPAVPNVDNLTIGNSALIRSTGGNILLQAGDNIVQNTGTLINTTVAGKTITLTAAYNDNDSNGGITQNGTAQIVSNNGNITLTAHDTISVMYVNAGNAVLTATSTNGSIEETTNDPAADLIAGTIILQAATGVGTLGTLEITGTNISIDSSGSGAIDVLSLAINPVVVSSLTTGTPGGGIENGPITFAQTGNQPLTVQNASTQQGNIVVTNTGANLTIGTMTAGADPGSTASNVVLTTLTSGDVYVDNVTAAGDRITITSAGAIEETPVDTTADLTAYELVLNAQTGIGNLNTLETQASRLDAVNVNNKIDIKNFGALTLIDLNADGFSVKNTNGATTIVATSPLTVASDVISGSDILLAAMENNGAGDDLSVNANITSTGGNILLMAGDNITQATLTTIQTNTAGKTIQLIAASGDTDNIGGITQNGTALIQSNNGAITLTARDTISLMNVIAGTSSITVTSTNASIEETTNDAAADLTASTLVLKAATGIGTTGTAPIETAATTISADTTNGNINLANTNAAATTATSLTTGTGNILFSQAGGGPLTVNTATTGIGNIGISVTGADLTALVVSAGTVGGGVGNGNVTLTTTGSGNIFVDNITALSDTITINSVGAIEELLPGDAAVDLSAGALVLTAVTGIGTNAAAPIEIAASTITANTTNGNINLANTNGGATTATSITTGVGNIILTQNGGGPLTVTNAVTGSGYVSIGVTQGDLIAGTITAGGNNPVNLMTTTSGNILVDNVTAASNIVTIISAGSIEELGADAGADVTASSARLVAVNGIGSLGTIETALSNLAASNTLHDINLANTGALNITTVATAATPGPAGSTSGITNGTGNIIVDNIGAITISQPVLVTTSGNINITAHSPITVLANVTAPGDITLTALETTPAAAGDNLTIGDGVATPTIQSTGGNILLQAGDNIVQNLGTTIQTTGAGKTITLTAAYNDNDNSGGITQNDTAQIVSNNGNITLNARDTISLQSVNAGTALLTVTSTNASIEETTNDVTVDLTAGTLVLKAVTGIGTTATAPIEIAATTISADTTGGNINLANTNTVATTATSLTTGTGDINFTQTGGGPLTVTNAVTTVGNINIGVTGADLTAVTVTAGGSGKNVTLTTITSGNVLVDNVTADGDQITITSAGSIEEVLPGDAAVDLTAAVLNLNAVSGIGTNAAAPIETAATTITANTTNGNIGLANANAAATTATSLTTGTGNILFTQVGGGPLTVTNATTTNGNILIFSDATMTATSVIAGGPGTYIVLSATSGDLLVGDVEDAGNYVKLAAAGAVVDNKAGNNVIANTLAIDAGTGIGSGDALETQVTNLAARVTTGNGNIEVANTGNLYLVDAAGWGYAVQNFGTGGINLSAASDVVVISPVISHGGAVVLNATTGSINQVLGGNILTNGGSYTGTASGSYWMADGSVVNTCNGAITVTAGGDITIGQLITADTVHLTAGGAIFDGDTCGGSCSSEDILADTAILSAGTGIGNGNPIEIKVNNLTATTLTGLININTRGAITLTDLETTGSGDILFTSSGTITATKVIATGGNIALNTTSGDIIAGDIEAVGNVIMLTAAGAVSSGPANNIKATTLVIDAGTGIGSGNALKTQVANLAARVTTGNGNIEVANTGNLYLVDAAGWSYAVQNFGTGGINISAASDVAVISPVISHGGAVVLNATTGSIIQVLGGNILTNGGSYTGTASGNYWMADGAVVNTGNGSLKVNAGGDITIGQLIATEIAQITSGGAIINGGNTGGENIQTETAILSANTGIGNGNPIETNVNDLTATTVAGPININETDAIRLVDIETGNGNIAITSGNTMTATKVIGAGSGAFISLSTAGDLLAGDIEAVGGYVKLAAAGAVIDNNGDLNNVIANTLAIDAGTGIGSGGALETQVTNLAARVTTGNGNIEVANTGNLYLVDAAGWGYAVQNFGTGGINISAASDVVVISPVISHGGAVVLNATAGSIIQVPGGNILTNGGSYTGTASGVYWMADGAIVDTGSGVLTVNAGGNMTVNQFTTTGIILLNSGGDIFVGDIEAVGGYVKLAATGAVIDNNGDLNNVIANTLAIDAGTGIGSGGALETQVTNLAARVTTGNGNIEVANTGNLYLVDAAGWGYAVQNFGTGGINISAASDVVVISPVISHGGAVVLNATAGSIIQVPGGNILTNGGSYTGTASGVYWMADGAIVDTGSGVLTVNAGGNMTVNQFTSTGVILLNSGGAILNGRTGGGVNIKADTAGLSAVTGIGVGNAIRTHVNHISSTTITGPINIIEVDDPSIGALDNKVDKSTMNIDKNNDNISASSSQIWRFNGRTWEQNELDAQIAEAGNPEEIFRAVTPDLKIETREFTKYAVVLFEPVTDAKISESLDQDDFSAQMKKKWWRFIAR